jgi:ribosomal protein L13E
MVIGRPKPLTHWGAKSSSLNALPLDGLNPLSNDTSSRYTTEPKSHRAGRGFSLAKCQLMMMEPQCAEAAYYPKPEERRT